jgi:hypothetical protein
MNKADFLKVLDQVPADAIFAIEGVGEGPFGTFDRIGGVVYNPATKVAVIFSTITVVKMQAAGTLERPEFSGLRLLLPPRQEPEVRK